MDTATSRCLLFMNLSAEARVCDAATAVPGGNNQIRCNGGACSCHIYITPDCVHPTCSPWMEVQFFINYWLPTFGSALNTLRVLGLPCNTLALETWGHFVGLAPMQAQHQQGECKREGLHVDCECFEVTDRGALILWYLTDILSEKVQTRLKKGFKLIFNYILISLFLWVCVWKWGHSNPLFWWRSCCTINVLSELLSAL